MKKKVKRRIAFILTWTLVLSSQMIPPRTTKATEYNLSDPRTDSDGVSTWDCIYFGHYYQSDASGQTKEPIKWRVLSVDGDDAFLLADQNLDVQPYNTEWADITWEDCTIRSWLNGYSTESNKAGKDYTDNNFIDTAFTLEEQSAILQSNVVNEDNPYYGTDGGNDTMDKIYLLSIAEASNATYGFNSDYNCESQTREAKNTAYVKANGVLSYEVAPYEKNGAWLLRSPGFDSNCAYSAVIDFDGYGRYNDIDWLFREGKAIRPVLHLNLSDSSLWKYAGKVSFEGGNQITESSETPKNTISPLPTVTLREPITNNKGITKWDCIYFGNYCQKTASGQTKEPIKWRVLSVKGDDAFLLADQNLDAKSYNETYTNVTWETCTMRSWLNGYDAASNKDGKDYTENNFIDTAFTWEEQNAILQSNVINEDNPYHGTDGGNATKDKIYLLSIAEVSNIAYGFNSKLDIGSKTRVAKNTVYVAFKTGMRDVDMANDWWLRSSGFDNKVASIIGENGYNNYELNNVIDDYNVAVRPALHLNISNANLWSYAGTVSADGGEIVQQSPTFSASPTPVPTVEPTVSVTPASTLSPTAEPTASVAPTTTPTPTTSSSATPTPTKKPSVVGPNGPSVIVTSNPGATATPSVSPDVTQSPEPTVTPTATPAETAVPTQAPIASETPAPEASAEPTTMPTVAPTTEPAPSAPVKPSTKPPRKPQVVAKATKGSIFKDSRTGAYYKILSTNGSKRSVAYAKPVNKKKQTVSMKASVTYQGKTYRITKIAEKALKGCKKLTQVSIGKNVTDIGASAFADCSGLNYLVLPKKVQRIGNKAFYRCKNLQYIYAKTTKLTLDSIGTEAFAAGYGSPRIKTKKSVWKRYSNIFLLRGMSKKALYVINPVPLIR